MTPQQACVIPSSIAVCPICGKGAVIESVDEVSRDDTGQLVPETISVTCESEPEMSGVEWCDWIDEHFKQPYVDWLPVQERVMAWLRLPEQRERVRVLWED